MDPKEKNAEPSRHTPFSAVLVLVGLLLLLVVISLAIFVLS